MKWLTTRHELHLDEMYGSHYEDSKIRILSPSARRIGIPDCDCEYPVVGESVYRKPHTEIQSERDEEHSFQTIVTSPILRFGVRTCFVKFWVSSVTYRLRGCCYRRKVLDIKILCVISTSCFEFSIRSNTVLILDLKISKSVLSYVYIDAHAVVSFVRKTSNGQYFFKDKATKR